MTTNLHYAIGNVLRKLKETDKKWDYYKEEAKREVNQNSDMTEKELQNLLVKLCLRLYK